MTGPPAYQRFLAELKRRRVFRVMAVYGVVGFVVLQVVDLAVPALLLPEWTYRFVAFLLLIGFPVAIVLAWAFDRTPGGIQRTEKAAPGEISEMVAASAAQRWPVGLAAAAGTALLLIGAWWVIGDQRSESAGALLDPDAPVESIAVLPFADLSPDGDQAYFGDGLAEELLDALANVDGLVVAARTSSFRFRGDTVDIADVAKQLNVQTVLEGSVRSGGNRVRITAQLVNSSGFHIWSESYDRSVEEMEDLIQVQEEIAQNIVAALSLTPESTAGEALETLVVQGTSNLEAYNADLRGRHLMAQRSPRGLEAAAEQFERAVALDPDYARAWADLSMNNNLRIAWAFSRDSLVKLRGAEAAERALELDPRMAEAYAARGYIYAWIEPDSAKAQQDFARAIELDPRFSTAYHWRGEILSDIGYPESGIPYLETARDLDPLSPIILTDLANAYDEAERYAEADSLIASVLELEPSFPPALDASVSFSRRNGDAAAALEYVKLFDSVTQGSARRSNLTSYLMFNGDYEAAIREFRSAMPSDLSAVSEELYNSLGEFLASLFVVEGAAAVRSFVAKHVAQVILVDSAEAIYMEGYAAAVSDDEAGTRAAIERLEYEPYQMRLLATIRDVPAVMEILDSIPENRRDAFLRFELEHRAQFQAIHDEPQFQAFLDKLPPYAGRAGER